MFSEPLLTTASRDEVLAIAAHELAHLEDYTVRKRWSLLRFSGVALIFGTLVFPWLASLSDGHRWIGFLTWVFTWLGMYKGYGLRRLAEEDDSDRRALTIGADPEALVRALSLGYRISGVPRRLARNAELGATHPSLARRCARIRFLAGLPEPEIYSLGCRTCDGGIVTIDADGVSLEGGPSGKPRNDRFAWDNLSDLLLLPGKDSTRLMIRRVQDARSTLLTFDNDTTEEIAPLLERADGRIAPLTRLMRSRHIRGGKRSAVRILGVLGAIASGVASKGIGPGALLVAIVVWFACVFVPTRRWMSAALAVGVFTFCFGMSLAPVDETGGLMILIPIGVWYAICLGSRRRDAVLAYPRGRWWIVPLVTSPFALLFLLNPNGRAMALAAWAVAMAGAFSQSRKLSRVLRGAQAQARAD